MTIPFYLIVFVLLTHWLADFVFQTDEMAKGKSKSLDILLEHIVVYTLMLCIITWPIIGLSSISCLKLSTFVFWAPLNGILHFFVDYITAPIVSKLFAAEDHHNAFVVIGLDQLVHTIYLLSTLLLFII